MNQEMLDELNEIKNDICNVPLQYSLESLCDVLIILAEKVQEILIEIDSQETYQMEQRERGE